MKYEALYHRTVGVLEHAFFKDDLQHGNCHKCAVGNIINANRPFSDYEKNLLGAERDLKRGWSAVFCTYDAHTERVSQVFNFDKFDDLAKSQIYASGYNVYELAKIEYAFETADRGKSDEDYMFNGLCACIDALDIIHENTDAYVSANSKNKFIKKQVCVS